MVTENKDMQNIPKINNTESFSIKELFFSSRGDAVETG